MTYCHIRLRLLSSAPLGRDSVPEVYISRTGSSSATGTYGAPGACANQVAMSVQPSGAPPIATRSATVPADAATARSATGANACSATKQRASLWSRMNAISSAPSMKFTGTSTTPTRAVAKSSTANCQQLWLSSASRSPFSSPESSERGRRTVDEVLERRERQPGLAVDDADLVRVAQRRTAGQVAEGLLAGVLDQVIEMRHASP